MIGVVADHRDAAKDSAEGLLEPAVMAPTSHKGSGGI